MSSASRSLLAGLAAAALTGPAVWFFAARRAPAALSPAGEIEQLRAANEELRRRTATLEQESAQLREQLTAQGIKLPPPAAGASASDDVQQRLEAVRQLGVLQNRLASAQSSLSELQNRTQELEATVSSLTAENKRAQSESSDLKENLASTTRIVQAMESELKAKSNRLTQLETAARRQRDDAAANAQKLQTLQTLTAVLRDLEDVNRRRENTITVLQRRYRDLTDQFRATAQRLDADRDSITPLAGDVSRIQSTVQTAEDDLRQLTTLNAQAKSIAQKLTR